MKRRAGVPQASSSHSDSNDRTHVHDEKQTLDDPWSRLGSADDGDLFIFVASRRSESFAWEVPSSDVELLAGVGAWGDSMPKSDDTFESLLLMGLDIGMNL